MRFDRKKSESLQTDKKLKDLSPFQTNNWKNGCLKISQFQTGSKVSSKFPLVPKKKNKMKITIFFLKLHLSLFIISYCMICTKQKKFWSSLIDQIFCRRRRWWRNWVIFIQGVPYGWVIFDWCEYFLLLSRGVVGKERTLFKTLSKNKWSNINTL